MERGPFLLEVKCNRWHGHFVGDAQKYRGQVAVEEAMADDCLQRFEDQLFRTKRLDRDQAAEIDRTVTGGNSGGCEFCQE